MLNLTTRKLTENNTRPKPRRKPMTETDRIIRKLAIQSALKPIAAILWFAAIFLLFSWMADWAIQKADAADGWVYDAGSRTMMITAEADGTHATFMIKTNQQQTKAMLIYQPTPQAGAAPMLVKEMDTQVDESDRWGYEVITVRNAYDGGTGIVIDQDFYDECMSASDLMVIVYPEGSPAITYWMPLTGFTEAAGQMPALARAVQGENRL